MLLLSNPNNDSNQGNKTTIEAVATIDHVVKITEATRVSPGTTSPEMVNTVFTAK